MLNFVLCDDNIPTLKRLSKMLESIFITHNIEAQIGLTTSFPNEVLEYIEKTTVNVVVLDINLKSDLNGCDLADAIRKENKDIYIIFLTGHLEYALLAYKYKTFDYLPKPITDERLEATILRLLDDVHTSKAPFIKLNNNKTIINPKEINFIKKDGMKIVFCATNHNYEFYSSFKKIENCLPDNFVRCHKSYMVNLDNITGYNAKDNSIIFSNNSTCFVGTKYKENLKEVLHNEFITKSLESVNN